MTDGNLKDSESVISSHVESDNLDDISVTVPGPINDHGPNDGCQCLPVWQLSSLLADSLIRSWYLSIRNCASNAGLAFDDDLTISTTSCSY